MSRVKLFGNSRKSTHSAEKSGTQKQAVQAYTKSGKPKKALWKRVMTVILVIILLLESMYYTVVYSDFSPIATLRDMYIETAMTTATHQWLATWLFPESMVNASMEALYASMDEQIGITSSWGEDTAETEEAAETETETEPETEPEESVPAEEAETVTEEETPVTEDVVEEEETVDPEAEARAAFFEEFWEVDEDSFDTYAAAHPELLADGWDSIYINEAGLDDSGTDIYTIYGDQILAIDVPNQLLLIRVSGTSYRGVLAICKDETQVRIGASTGIGSYGQYAGVIAQQENAVFAVNASGFIDPNGVGNGGTLAGYTVFQGTRMGDHMGWGYKRIELREDNRLYIVDSQTTPGDDVTDAVEFYPAMIVDGEILVDETNYNSLQPRSCVGQTSNYDIMYLVVEGRQTSSLGITLLECAEIMAKYDCVQAMNQDGGSSAIMWYNGEYIISCSNGYEPGRQLPNAWVYGDSSS